MWYNTNITITDMSFETCGRSSFEKQDKTLNPEFMTLCHSLDFRNQDALRKFALLSPEAQALLLPWLKTINDDHQSHMALIQNNTNKWYLWALDNWTLQV